MQSSRSLRMCNSMSGTVSALCFLATTFSCEPSKCHFLISMDDQTLRMRSRIHRVRTVTTTTTDNDSGEVGKVEEVDRNISVILSSGIMFREDYVWL